jgi:uncharacterized repeat protein (TIGR03806 family)
LVVGRRNVCYFALTDAVKIQEAVMTKHSLRRFTIGRAGTALLVCLLGATALQGQEQPYGLDKRVPNNSLLIDLAAGPPPPTVSASGFFSDIAAQTPAPGLIPYGVNAGLWSDGAYKTRYLALPGTSQIEFSAEGYWDFPPNSVLVKNFYLELVKGDPQSRQIIETRFLVKKGESDEWAGFSYQWNEDASDAVLLEDSETLSIFIVDPEAPDGFAEQRYFFPGPEDCSLCHREAAGRVLGPRTAQLNGDYDYGGIVDNQLRALNHIGVFSTDINETIGEDYDALPRWVDPLDEDEPLDKRGRSYLATNCSHCHRPNGVDRASIDLRYDTPLALTNTVDISPQLGRLDAPEARIISPGDADNSTILLRMLTFNSNRMPPVATSVIDEEGTATMRRWLDQMGVATHVEATEVSPAAFELLPSRPNPFNPSTTIEYRVNLAGAVHLAIYDVLGQHVRTLVEAERTPGRYTVEWDGRDGQGLEAASGAYLYRLHAGSFVATRRLTLLR